MTAPTVSRPTRLEMSPPVPPCQCRHREGAETQRCLEPTEVRVTVICVEPGCDCAAAVHLICRPCLAVWQRTAEEHDVELRVRPL